MTLGDGSVSTHTSFLTPPLPATSPVARTSRSAADEYAPCACVRCESGTPAVWTCDHCGIPPRPFALERIHTLLSLALDDPPVSNTRFVVASYTNVPQHRADGAMPVGVSCTHCA